MRDSYVSEVEKKDKNKEQTKKYREGNKIKIKEQRKIYREENKNKIKEQTKKYYQKNKEEINKKNKIRVNCPHCNIELSKSYLSRHIKNSCKVANN